MEDKPVIEQEIIDDDLKRYELLKEIKDIIKDDESLVHPSDLTVDILAQEMDISRYKAHKFFIELARKYPDKYKLIKVRNYSGMGNVCVLRKKE